VSLGVCEPLHGSSIDTHGWLADNVWIARHASEAVAGFAQDHFIALCICIDDSCGLRNVIWSSGRMPELGTRVAPAVRERLAAKSKLSETANVVSTLARKVAIHHRASPDGSDAARWPGRSQWTERNRDVRLKATKHLHQTLNLARRRGLAGFKIALNA
jgi:hypothetical protein